MHREHLPGELCPVPPTSYHMVSHSEFPETEGGVASGGKRGAENRKRMERN